MTDLFETLLVQTLLVLELQLAVDLSALGGGVAVVDGGLRRVLLAELGLGVVDAVLVAAGVGLAALRGELVGDGALVLWRLLVFVWFVSRVGYKATYWSPGSCGCRAHPACSQGASARTGERCAGHRPRRGCRCRRRIGPEFQS